MIRSINVYLDTQDYSRLADAESGRGEESAKNILKKLRAQKAAGIANFIYSSMNLSELLQYEGGGRELTLRKASIVSSLAGDRCFWNPPKIIAYEIAKVASENGYTLSGKLPKNPISESNDWHGAHGILDDFNPDEIKKEALFKALENHNTNRTQRRAAQRESQKIRVGSLIEKNISEITNKYPIPKDVLKRSIIQYIDRKISKQTAENILLANMGIPENFVIWYFENSRSEKDFPYWLRNMGISMTASISTLQEKAERFVGNPELYDQLKNTFRELSLDPARKIFGSIGDELEKLGMRSEDQIEFKANENLLILSPFFSVLSKLMPDYLLSHSGLKPHTRKPKFSDGADIVHAITLPYCDLWRGDIYFGTLLKKHSPALANRIVLKLEDLPDAIDIAYKHTN